MNQRITTHALASVAVDGALIRHVYERERTPEVCLAAVRQNGAAVQFLSDAERTPEVCLAAVQQFADALSFLSAEQATPEVCLAGVTQNGNSVRFLTSSQLTEEICLAAVKQNGHSLWYLLAAQRTPEVCLAAVTKSGRAIRYLKPAELTPEICLAAVKQDPQSFLYANSDLRQYILPHVIGYIAENKKEFEGIFEKLGLDIDKQIAAPVSAMPLPPSAEDDDWNLYSARKALVHPESIKNILSEAFILDPKKTSEWDDPKDSIWLNLPYEVSKTIQHGSGFKVDKSGRYPQGRLQITPELFEHLGTLIYGNTNSLPNNYFLEIIQRDANDFILISKYQQIIGSRFMGPVDKETVTQLVQRLTIDLAEKYGLTMPKATSIEVNPIKAVADVKMVDAELSEQLGALTARDGRIDLPESQLSRYADIKDLMLKAGGKYKSPSKGLPARFEFPVKMDTGEILAKLLGGDKINIKKETQFFATPTAAGEKLIGRLVERMGSLQGKRLLEPEAGQAALADLARDARAEVVTIENWDINADVLRAKGYEPIEKDFLAVRPEETGLFDAVLMNPPFSNRQDIAHVRHALSFLHEEGCLEAIVSTHFQHSTVKDAEKFRHLCDLAGCQPEVLDAGTFKESGTSVPTVMLSFDMERLLMRLEEVGSDGSEYGLDLSRQWALREQALEGEEIVNRFSA